MIRDWWQRRHADERDWPERRGRFEGLDRDTPDRPQVMPVERPARREDETHAPDIAAGRAEGRDEGPWRPDGD